MIKTTIADRKKIQENKKKEIAKIVNEEIDRRLERIVEALISAIGANPEGD